MNKLFGLFLLALAFLAPNAAYAVNCFWVGGTGTWDNSSTAHWAPTSGGGATGCQTTNAVPASGDAVTFDASSGTGTITVAATFNASNTIASLTMGALTGGSILDFATNDPNITITGTFSNNGSGTRRLDMGDGTWTVSANSGNVWLQNGATNLTFNANASTINFSGASSTTAKTTTLGAFTYNIVTFGASAGGYTMGGASIIATWNITAPTAINLAASTTQRMTNAVAVTGSSGSQVSFQSSTFGTTATLQLDAASTCSWCAFRDVTTTTSSMTATNSFDLGRNTLSGGGSISAPSGGGGGGGRIIGG